MECPPKNPADYKSEEDLAADYNSDDWDDDGYPDDLDDDDDDDDYDR